MIGTNLQHTQMFTILKHEIISKNKIEFIHSTICWTYTASVACLHKAAYFTCIWYVQYHLTYLANNVDVVGVVVVGIRVSNVKNHCATRNSLLMYLVNLNTVYFHYAWHNYCFCSLCSHIPMLCIDDVNKVKFHSGENSVLTQQNSSVDLMQILEIVMTSYGDDNMQWNFGKNAMWNCCEISKKNQMTNSKRILHFEKFSLLLNFWKMSWTFCKWTEFPRENHWNEKKTKSRVRWKSEWKFSLKRTISRVWAQKPQTQTHATIFHLSVRTAFSKTIATKDCYGTS